MRATLPYPPTVNTYWRVVRGRPILSAEARRYKAWTLLRARTQGMRPVDGPVCVSVTVYRPRRIGDLDNSLKALLDALKGAAYHDDSQVVELHARRLDDASDPRVEVTVEVTT